MQSMHRLSYLLSCYHFENFVSNNLNLNLNLNSLFEYIKIIFRVIYYKVQNKIRVKINNSGSFKKFRSLEIFFISFHDP